MDRADSDRPGPLASGPAQTIDRAGSAAAAGGVSAAVAAPARGPDAGPGGGGPGGFGWWRVFRVVRGPVAVQLAVLAGVVGGGTVGCLLGGAYMGRHAVMPLPGVVMMPVTVVFGPSASYNLLSVVMPGLLCYAMYRVARLWLASAVGALAA